MTHRPNRRTAVAIALALLAAASAHADPAPDAVARELIAITQSMMDALASGKSEVWQQALADDAVIIDEFGRAQGKAETVQGITGLPAGLSGHIKLVDPKVRVYGDTAVMTVDNDEYETVFGQQLHVVYRMTNTFVRRDGAWRLVSMHDVTVPTTPPTLHIAGLKLDDYPGVYRYGPKSAFTVALNGSTLSFTTHAGRTPTVLMPVARDVFMDDGDEKNLLVFQRDAAGHIESLIERRKFNDLLLKR